MVLETPKVRLFGVPSIPGDDREKRPLPVRETELLAFLALHRQKDLPRLVVADKLWGSLDERKARRCLNSTLWRLRKAIEERGAAPDRVLLSTSSGILRFDAHGPWSLDVDRFEEAAFVLARGTPPTGEALDQAERDLGDYRGDLMEGFYHDWVIRERERLRLLLIAGLAASMRLRIDDDPERAIELGQRILRVDPLREAVHREIMRLHMRLGHRGLALRQYEACRTLLREELGISPMRETISLHLRILKEELPTFEDPWHGNATPRWIGKTTRPPAHGSHGGEPSEPSEDPIAKELERASYHLARAHKLLKGKSPKVPGSD